MFDIKIGTQIPATAAAAMIPQLNQKGFESYEITFKKNAADSDMTEYAKQITSLLDGQVISCLGLYDNSFTEKVQDGIRNLIRSAHLFGCDRIGVFAGGDKERSVPEQIGDFKAAFTELAKEAEAAGVKIGFENCGNGWFGGCDENIAICPEAWELMFDAVPSDALGLEWEPCHQLVHLADPIAQLRKWAPKVVHMHGKDATVAWDVIREYGIRGAHPYAWHRTPGFGDTNWADVFTILLQAGFEGACDIEGYHDPVHYDDMEWTAQVTSLEYLKRCRGGLEYFPGPTEYRGYQGARKQ